MLSDTAKLILLVAIIGICFLYIILYMCKKNPSEPFTKLRAMVYSILIPIPILYIPSIFKVSHTIPNECPSNKSITVICNGVSYIDWFYIQNMMILGYPFMALLVWFWFDYKYLKWQGLGGSRMQRAAISFVIILSVFMWFPILYVRNFLLGN